ncbi:MAG: hypothetical protein V7K53_02605 [Nostoc sp.]
MQINFRREQVRSLRLSEQVLATRVIFKSQLPPGLARQKLSMTL